MTHTYQISTREGIDWQGAVILRYVILQDGITYMAESTDRAEAEAWIARRIDLDAAIVAAPNVFDDNDLITVPCPNLWS